jgi:hypothetical protein
MDRTRWVENAKNSQTAASSKRRQIAYKTTKKQICGSDERHFNKIVTREAVGGASDSLKKLYFLFPSFRLYWLILPP